jgi:hypothetical protein
MDLHFKQLNVYGLSIPTEVCISAILEEINDDESAKIFFQAHNEWALSQNLICNPCEYTLFSGTYDYELVMNYKRMETIVFVLGSILKLDAKTYIQSCAIISWHSSVRGMFTGGNLQEKRKIVSKYISNLKGKTSHDLSKSSYSVLPSIELLNLKGRSDNEILMMMHLFNAIKYTDNFFDTVRLVRKNIPYVEELYQELFNIENSIFKLIEKNDRDPDRTFSYRCPFCGVWKRVGRGKLPVTCKSPECLYKYKQNWDDTNRPPKGRDPEGWVVAFDGKPQECHGEKCLLDLPGKRQVNLSRICRQCFVEP